MPETADLFCQSCWLYQPHKRLSPDVFECSKCALRRDISEEM
jgi:hypothetical protein